MRTGSSLRIGFIGNGGVTCSVRDALAATAGFEHEVTGILSRSPGVNGGPEVLSAAALLATRPDIVIECASHEAVRSHGEDILRAGVPLMLVSTGVLADTAFYDRLVVAAGLGETRIILAAGAMAGIEALAAARVGGLTSVRYIGSKPPLAWQGTPAEQCVDLGALDRPFTFFRGSAREAALAYPKNSNVCATIALAGVGFDATEVELCADPTAPRNVHRLVFEGADGSFDIHIVGKPSPSNPKTSALTAHSIARLLTGMVSPVVI